MTQPQRYFDDFVVGDMIEAGSCSVSEDEIIHFAEQFDPQSFHIDREAAGQSIFKGIIASGWHTCGLMMRLVVDKVLHDAAAMGSPGIDEIRWLKPVRGGDVLTVTVEVLETRPSTSKPDRGVVTMAWKAKNQSGELVATIRSLALFRRRDQR